MSVGLASVSSPSSSMILHLYLSDQILGVALQFLLGIIYKLEVGRIFYLSRNLIQKMLMNN